MVCIYKINNVNKVKKATTKKNKKPLMDKELSVLRCLIPGNAGDKKSDLEVILETIGYIQSLENKLRSQSSADLLKAKFIAARRMTLQRTSNED